jgi:hypothetical protein
MATSNSRAMLFRTSRGSARRVAITAALIAVGLFVAGVIVWTTMTSTEHFCPPGVVSNCTRPDVHVAIHPRRAEGLWALSGISAAVALVAGIRWRFDRRRRSAIVMRSF